MQSFTTCTLHQTLLGLPNQGGGMGGAYSTNGRDGNASNILVGKP